MSDSATPDTLVKRFTFKPNTCAGRFFFWFGPLDVTEARAWYESFGCQDLDGRIIADEKVEFDGRVMYASTSHPFIHLTDIPHTPSDIGALTHEIHHAVMAHGHDIGVYSGVHQSEEFFAYMAGRLIEAALDFVWHDVHQLGVEVEA